MCARSRRISLERGGFRNAGRTAMSAGSFQTAGALHLLPLRASQFGVAYLVNEQELPNDYNGRASAIVTSEDAYALLQDIDRDATKRILPDLS